MLTLIATLIVWTIIEATCAKNTGPLTILIFVLLAAGLLGKMM